ncbi:MAG: DUF1559 domain-containing protein, partial [Planctomycetota bacterium]
MNRHRSLGRKDRSKGFTLIELIVAMSIIALVLAILIPAVLTARESQRRIVCSSRLSSLGQALHGHEASFAYFPSALKSQSENPKSSSLHYSAHIYLLPYLDQASVYSTIQFDLPYGDYLESQDYAGNPARNSTAKLARLPAFICPSDPANVKEYPGNNYRLNVGSQPSSIQSVLTPHGGHGAFASLENFRPTDFRDGLSSTIAMSERTIGSGQSGRFDRKKDYWDSGFNALNPSPTSDELVPVCSLGEASIPSSSIYPYSGSFWFYSGFETTLYNHANTPNSPNADCSSGPIRLPGTPGIVAARSFHSQGVNCLYMDGHASFVGDSID